ncbi:MAG: ergothioneine biosynthesis protein EgtB [Acidobacteria bacterium]|nr:ergothioneine biosynthesis protein EgtB [Acidobacteriota bacterium]
MATTLPTAGSAAQTSSLRSRYAAVRVETERMAAPLSAEDQMVQACAEASPVKWHRAHTTWFFETFVLREFAAGYKPFNEAFHWLFNSYYISLGEEIPEKKLRASFSRPALDEIVAYRAHVDAAMELFLSAGDVPDEAVRRIVLGLNHEQQHLELALTDIKFAFFTNPLHPPYRDMAAPRNESVPLSWTKFEGGLREIGYPLDASHPEDFCFDNETPRHTVYVPPFTIANRLATCAEYLEFMTDNGYGRAELWLSEGWDAVIREQWQAPLYWHRDASDKTGWKVFTLGAWRGLSGLLHTPVCHISFFEADAFARWSGRRLPTEAEYEIAAADIPSNGTLLEDGTLHPQSASTQELAQMIGDCWEWTASPYTGYPGYRPLPGALGEYNGKFMSSQMVLRGGSCATPASHIRSTYRNFFPPATRWQFSGIRLAQ